MNLVKI